MSLTHHGVEHRRPRPVVLDLSYAALLKDPEANMLCNIRRLCNTYTLHTYSANTEWSSEFLTRSWNALIMISKLPLYKTIPSVQGWRCDDRGASGGARRDQHGGGRQDPPRAAHAAAARSGCRGPAAGHLHPQRCAAERVQGPHGSQGPLKPFATPKTDHPRW